MPTGDELQDSIDYLLSPGLIQSYSLHVPRHAEPVNFYFAPAGLAPSEYEGDGSLPDLITHRQHMRERARRASHRHPRMAGS